MKWLQLQQPTKFAQLSNILTLCYRLSKSCKHVSASLCCLARLFDSSSSDIDSDDSEEGQVAPTSQPCNWLKPRSQTTKVLPAHTVKLKRHEMPRRSKRQFKQLQGFDPQHPKCRKPIMHESSMTWLAGQLREERQRKYFTTPAEQILAKHYDYPPSLSESELVHTV